MKRESGIWIQEDVVLSGIQNVVKSMRITLVLYGRVFGASVTSSTIVLQYIEYIQHPTTVLEYHINKVVLSTGFAVDSALRMYGVHTVQYHILSACKASRASTASIAITVLLAVLV